MFRSFPASLRAERLTVKNVILVIEVAVSSLNYDRGLKASRYARFGVPEYWVIDASRQTTFLHRMPLADGSWGESETRGPEEILSHLAIPGWATRLSTV
jgi:Uma2 family endonuclease